MSNLQPIITEKYETSTYIKLMAFVSNLKLKHFSAVEIYNTLARNHRPNYIPDEILENLAAPLLVYDAMRDDLGFKIKLTSTYRDPEHNREVNGKPDSLHLKASAVDAQPWFYRQNSILKMHQWLQHTKIIIFYKGWKVDNSKLGIGLYDSFTHVDDRGRLGRFSPVTWRGK